MQEMIIKIDESSKKFQKEIDKDDKKIFVTNLKDEDLTEYRHYSQQKNKRFQNNYSPTESAIQDLEKESIIFKLQKSLQEDNEIPTDICNQLQAELDQKQKLRKLETYQDSSENNRIDLRKLYLIKKEFESLEGSQRSIQILDQILGRLKFFQRFSHEQRKKVFEMAQYASYPSQHKVFEQGEKGDKMYVILKGRVSVLIKQPNYGNLEMLVAILKDGDHFGELSLIDQGKVDAHTKDAGIIDEDDQLLTGVQKSRFVGRKATCVCIEKTDMLILDRTLISLLYQPQKNKDQNDSDRIKGVDSASLNTSARNDMLSRKIRILQNVPYFRDIISRKLMPIAANATFRSYKYGEYLVEKGKVPDGLFIILKGQCQAVISRQASRSLNSQNMTNDFLNWKPAMNGHLNSQNKSKQASYKQMNINDHLIKNFDPATSALQGVKTDGKAFQNQRILINNKGTEIKSHALYNDFMIFSQLVQGDCFGGRTLLPYEEFYRMTRELFGVKSLEKYYPLNCNYKQLSQEPIEIYHMKSLLSIVADSANVDVWIIDKTDLNYLTEKQDLRRVYESIAGTKEADRPYHEQDIDFLVDQFIKWDKHKVNVVEAIHEKRIHDKIMNGQLK